MQRRNCSHCKGNYCIAGKWELLYCWEKEILALLGKGNSCSENGILALLEKVNYCTAGKRELFHCWEKGIIALLGKGNYCIAGKRELFHCREKGIIVLNNGFCEH